MQSTDNLLDNCDGIKLVALSATIASFLAENLSLDDQNVIGNLLLGVGQNLVIIASQNSKYQNCIQTCEDYEVNKS